MLTGLISEGGGVQHGSSVRGQLAALSGADASLTPRSGEAVTPAADPREAVTQAAA